MVTLTFYWYNVVAIIFYIALLCWICYWFYQEKFECGYLAGFYSALMRLLGYAAGIIFLAVWGGIFWW